MTLSATGKSFMAVSRGHVGYQRFGGIIYECGNKGKEAGSQFL
jgi:hypothetical protein